MSGDLYNGIVIEENAPLTDDGRDGSTADKRISLFYGREACNLYALRRRHSDVKVAWNENPKTIEALILEAERLGAERGDSDE